MDMKKSYSFLDCIGYWYLFYRAFCVLVVFVFLVRDWGDWFEISIIFIVLCTVYLLYPAISFYKKILDIDRDKLLLRESFFGDVIELDLNELGGFTTKKMDGEVYGIVFKRDNSEIHYVPNRSYKRVNCVVMELLKFRDIKEKVET